MPTFHLPGLIIIIIAPIVLPGDNGLFEADERGRFGGHLVLEGREELKRDSIALRDHDQYSGIRVQAELFIDSTSQQTGVIIVIEWVGDDDDLSLSQFRVIV